LLYFYALFLAVNVTGGGVMSGDEEWEAKNWALKEAAGLVWFWSLLYAHRHRSILEAAGHILLTPANQLMVMGLKIWSLSNPGSNQRPFDHWATS
jgi:hypothetical protein